MDLSFTSIIDEKVNAYSGETLMTLGLAKTIVEKLKNKAQGEGTPEELRRQGPAPEEEFVDDYDVEREMKELYPEEDQPVKLQGDFRPTYSLSGPSESDFVTSIRERLLRNSK